MKKNKIKVDSKIYFRDGGGSKKIKPIQTQKNKKQTKKTKTQKQKQKPAWKHNEVDIVTYKFQVIGQSQDEMFNCNCIQQVSTHYYCRLRQAPLSLVNCKND